jgi:hypothetical protein
VDASLRLLSTQSGNLDAAQRSRLLQLALPVIALQGGEALSHAERFAQALQAELPPSQRATLQAQASAPLWKVFTAQSLRRVTASGEIQAARDCFHATRSPEVARALADFLEGDVDAAALAHRVSAARVSFLEALEAIETAARTAHSTEGMRDALLKAARQLQVQIEQRLQLIRARIDLEKREFDESLEDRSMTREMPSRSRPLAFFATPTNESRARGNSWPVQASVVNWSGASRGPSACTPRG